MKVSVLRRIEALEQRVKQGTEPPTLIMIHYDERQEKWVVKEHYVHGNKAEHYKVKETALARLQEYCFQPDFNGRVILDAFSSCDPTVYQNLYCFDIADLRRDLQAEDTGAVFIEAIKKIPGDESLTVEIVAATKQ